MKKVFFILLGLVMMAGFLPVKSNTTSDDVAFGCVMISCIGDVVCDKELAAPNVAAEVSGIFEWLLCEEEPLIYFV